mgnify:CR=1 FL=1
MRSQANALVVPTYRLLVYNRTSGLYIGMYRLSPYGAPRYVRIRTQSLLQILPSPYESFLTSHPLLLCLSLPRLCLCANRTRHLIPLDRDAELPL